MFTTRLISGIVLVILALVVVGQGGALLLVTSAVISCIGLFELYRVTKMQDRLIMYFCGMGRGSTLICW